MDIADLLNAEDVFIPSRGNAKPRLIEELARRASKKTELPEATILAALMAREELGSTGIGEGVAVPHARIGGLSKPFALFCRLLRPIDFAAVDGEPVDLVFLLLTPEGDGAGHLEALACISRRLRDKAVARALRAARKPARLYEALSGQAG